MNSLSHAFLSCFSAKSTRIQTLKTRMLGAVMAAVDELLNDDDLLREHSDAPAQPHVPQCACAFIWLLTPANRLLGETTTILMSILTHLRSNTSSSRCDRPESRP